MVWIKFMFIKLFSVFPKNRYHLLYLVVFYVRPCLLEWIPHLFRSQTFQLVDIYIYNIASEKEADTLESLFIFDRVVSSIYLKKREIYFNIKWVHIKLGKPMEMPALMTCDISSHNNNNDVIVMILIAVIYWDSLY